MRFRLTYSPTQYTSAVSSCICQTGWDFCIFVALRVTSPFGQRTAKSLNGAKYVWQWPFQRGRLQSRPSNIIKRYKNANRKKVLQCLDLATPMVDELQNDIGGMCRGLKERPTIHRDELVRVAVWDPDVTAGVGKPFCVRVHPQLELSAAFTFLVSRHQGLLDQPLGELGCCVHQQALHFTVEFRPFGLGPGDLTALGIPGLNRQSWEIVFATADCSSFLPLKVQAWPQIQYFSYCFKYKWLFFTDFC